MATILDRRQHFTSFLPNITSAQIECDQLLNSFTTGASDWKSLLGMTAGSFAYRLTKLSVLSSPFARFVPQGARYFSNVVALGAEVSSFRAIADSNESHNWFADYVNFASLKIWGGLARKTNPIFSHVLQDAGIVMGHQLAYSLGVATQAQGNWVKQFLHAEQVNLQMRAGQSLFNQLSGGRLNHAERILESRLESFASSNSWPLSFVQDPHHASFLFSSQKPSVEAYQAHQRKLLDRVPGRDFSYEKHDLEIRINEEELGHVSRWKEKGLLLSVSVFIRDAEGRILLTHDRKGKRGIPRIPSGGAEFLDQSLEEVAVREMREELGAEVEVLRRVAWYQSLMYYQGIPVTPWNTAILEARLKSPIVLPEGGELKAVEWIEPQSPISFSMEGFFPQFDRHANDTLRAYMKRYPVCEGDLPWADAETLHSLLDINAPEWIQRSRNREYGRHRLTVNSTSQVEYVLPDGRILRLFVSTNDAENLERALERKIDRLEMDIPGQEHSEHRHFYGSDKPSIAQILAEYGIQEGAVGGVTELLSFDASPHVNSYYRIYRYAGDLSTRVFRWNWRDGIVEFEDFGHQGISWSTQKGIFTRHDLNEFVGHQLREQNRRAFLEMKAEGIIFANIPLQEFLREKYPECRVIKMESDGQEADAFMVMGPKDVPLFIAKEFRRYSIDETSEMLAQDQVLAMWRAQKAIETSNLQNIRYARIHALGQGWMLREYIPPENLGITSQDIPIVRGVSQKIGQELGVLNVDLKFVSLAIQLGISSSNLGHNMAREILPDGSLRYVIYDPL